MGFDIANDRLAAVHVDVLDSYMLLATPTPAAQGFLLKGECLEQPSGGCSECDDPALRAATACEPRENRHCGGMGAGHLDGQHALDLIPRSGSLNRGSCCNHGNFGNQHCTGAVWRLRRPVAVPEIAVLGTPQRTWGQFTAQVTPPPETGGCTTMGRLA
jgi:hypothetical protein